MTSLKSVIRKFEGKSARVGIVGLGYVGLPLLLEFAQAGLATLGLDIDQSKIDALRKRTSYIKHIPSSRIDKVQEGSFEVTSDFSEAHNVDALILCVPTPLSKNREPDLGFVLDTLESLLPYIRDGQLIVLESTTYPGTTAEELAPRIESKGFKIGIDIFLAYSPEREDPGNLKFSTRTIPKVVGGHTDECKKVAIALYAHTIDQLVPVSSTQAAELTKLLENIHRAVNIGLVNEMKVIAAQMGIDIYEVIEAAATKPFGFVPYYPGPGLGGHCIPIDPFYLTWKARQFGINTRFIELSGEVNSSMPQYVTDRLMIALNEKGKPVNGSSVLILGIAYKKNVDDMRESPSVQIMDMLRQLGANVEYSDPWVPTFPVMRNHSWDLESVDLTQERLSKVDVVLLATDHDCFDYDFIERHAQIIVDCRGRFRGRNAANIVPA